MAMTEPHIDRPWSAKELNDLVRGLQKRHEDEVRQKAVELAREEPRRGAGG
jgi:hypothetical protein